MPGTFFEFDWYSKKHGTANALAKVRPGNKYPALLEAELLSIMSERLLKDSEKQEASKKDIWLPHSGKIGRVYTAIRSVTLDDRRNNRTNNFDCEFYFVANFKEEFGVQAIIIGSRDIHKAFTTHNNPGGSYYKLEE